MIVCLLDLVCLHALAYDAQVIPLSWVYTTKLYSYVCLCAVVQPEMMHQGSQKNHSFITINNHHSSICLSAPALALRIHSEH